MSRRIVFAAATALMASMFVVAPVAANEPPQNVKCHSGDILTGFYKNVYVPPGNYCLLLQAIVEGNVYANGAVQLGVDNSTVTGSIFANHVSSNGWICGSRIGTDVWVDYAASSSVSPGSWVIGDASFCTTQFDPVPGNFILGDLYFTHNKSGGMISNNDIEENLVCAGNVPPPTGSNNQVDGKNSGQCALLAGGADTDVTSPGDND